ncbi:MAG: hypothetical protein MJ252_17080 [archaeon]|nr:hypothetical protein [archaeon]
MCVIGFMILFTPDKYYSNHLMQVEQYERLTQVREQKALARVESDARVSVNEEIEDEEDKNKGETDSKYIIFISNVDINRLTKSKDDPPFMDAFCTIITRPMFIIGSFAYAISFYAMGALKFWAPTYFSNVIHMDDNIISIVFSAICLTGPTFGLVIGGLTGSLIGGYQAKIAIIIVFIYDIIDIIIGLISVPLNNSIAVTISIWLFFFFATAVIPIETGLIIGSVKERLKGAANSIANFILNIIGNLPPSYIYGLIDERFGQDSPKLAYTWVMIIRGTSILFLVPGIFVRYFSKEAKESSENNEKDNNENEKDNNEKDNNESTDTNENKEESKEIIS